jgi:predicted 3-demethylubiquinone-9 3-methyltransferase (glyoxalase superfamily)
MSKSIYTCIWLKENALEVANYYASIFPNGRILRQNPWVVKCEFNNTHFMLLNGNPDQQFNESYSFVVECETQAEIDHYWAKLSEGGEEKMCGWVTDKYGISWQIVPSVLEVLMSTPDRREAVTNAFLKMKKFDIQGLLDAK